MPEQCPQGVANLWRACTALDTSARPSATDVLVKLEKLASLGQPVQPLVQLAVQGANAAAAGAEFASLCPPHTPLQSMQGG